MTALGWGTSRRSFFLAFFAVRNGPRNLKRPENCSAEKAKQKNDLFKCHGKSPLSALGRPGEAQLQKKIALPGA